MPRALVACCVFFALVAFQTAPLLPRKTPFGLAQEGRVLEALVLAEAQHEQSPQDSMRTDTLGVLRSFVGDGQGALEAFESMSRGTPLFDAAELEDLARCTPEDALAAIVAASKGRQVVILNEAHHVPLHRAFALELARALRKEGFEWFAAETFAAPEMESLRARGFPTRTTGFYSNEPVFGDLIRECLALGYRPVAYEVEERPPSPDPTDSINHRESEQSRHLVERIFAEHPDARVFVHVGYSHATEDWQKLADGRELAWMAARLGRALDLDPLTIDQTEQMPASVPDRASLAWRAAHSKGWLTAPRLLRRADGSCFVSGRGWRGKVDLQVFHPPVTLVDGRPDWLTRDGRRNPVEIPVELEPTEEQRRVLIQAFAADETDDAIPVDQVVVHAGELAPVLLLPDGEFRVVAQDESGREIGRQMLER